MLMLTVQALELTIIEVFRTVATKIATTIARRPHRTMIHTLTAAPPNSSETWAGARSCCRTCARCSGWSDRATYRCRRRSEGEDRAVC